jgi:hypothetical protein
LAQAGGDCLYLLRSGGALAVYGAKESGDYIASNPEVLEQREDLKPKADAFDHSEGPFTSIW